MRKIILCTMCLLLTACTYKTHEEHKDQKIIICPITTTDKATPFAIPYGWHVISADIYAHSIIIIVERN